MSECQTLDVYILNILYFVIPAYFLPLRGARTRVTKQSHFFPCHCGL